MPRRYDPERRQRIIDAAIRVAGAKGIGGLSHRSVAAEADVPLGSTTYHFKTLDELLVAALRQANEGFAKAVAASGAFEDPRADLASELAALLGQWLAGERAGVELEYELYLAALRRPALRPVAAEWCQGIGDELAGRVDPVTVRALVALMDGICLQVLLTDTPYDEAFTAEMLNRLLAPGGRTGPREAACGPDRETGSPARHRSG
ncbi:TetR/AcrR family transcriptional regulator [Streptomyces flavofungini]|uniref:TetR/AcrR family transcriptional regulator n=1 Tax=Streptomyces flavofungini TaxID=68200 RepID=UPI0034DF031B